MASANRSSRRARFVLDEATAMASSSVSEASTTSRKRARKETSNENDLTQAGESANQASSSFSALTPQPAFASVGPLHSSDALGLDDRTASIRNDFLAPIESLLNATYDGGEEMLVERDVFGDSTAMASAANATGTAYSSSGFDTFTDGGAPLTNTGVIEPPSLDPDLIPFVPTQHPTQPVQAPNATGLPVGTANNVPLNRMASPTTASRNRQSRYHRRQTSRRRFLSPNNWQGSHTGGSPNALENENSDDDALSDGGIRRARPSSPDLLFARPSSASGVPSSSRPHPILDDETHASSNSPQASRYQPLWDQSFFASSINSTSPTPLRTRARVASPTNRPTNGLHTRLAATARRFQRSYMPSTVQVAEDIDHLFTPLSTEEDEMEVVMDNALEEYLTNLMSDQESSMVDGTAGILAAPGDDMQRQALSMTPGNSNAASRARAALSVALSRISGGRIPQAFKQGAGNLLNDVNPRRVYFGNPGISRAVVVPQDCAAVFAYFIEPAPTGSDVWPDIRDRYKVPAKYVPLKIDSVLNYRSRESAFARAGPDPTPPGNGFHVTWPMKKLASELYRSIIGYLSREDIKAMRMTCKEFEDEVSHALFRNVVVPFNTEIYGMLRTTPSGFVDVKGKSKAKVKKSNSGSMIWQNANDDDIYDGQGINVFMGFGRHIKKYGMSFEVTEEALANPPLKGTREAHQSYWGEYDWPYQEYKRFDEVAGLENAADETFKMKTAFSFLTEVKELALSIDSGLGYLHGPDVSIRSKIFRPRPAVFGHSRVVPDRKQQAAQQLWDALKAAYRSDSNTCGAELAHAALFYRESPLSRQEWRYVVRTFMQTLPTGNAGMPFLDRQLLDSPLKTFIDDGDHYMEDDRFVSGFIFAKDDTNENEKFENAPVVPASLKKLQREWLLETEWAQRAFLSSYMVAIVDNPHTFREVHTMNFARLSSRYIVSICRQDFWNALPYLRNITMHVIPDWRDVYKDNAGFVETPAIAPSLALVSFQKLLSDIISPMRHIKSLNIGWAAGGENEPGIHSRNKNLMPAPVLPHAWLSAMNLADNLGDQMVLFHHVQHLTLTNCWITPGVLQLLITKHQEKSLTHLTLDSVSLTAVPRRTDGNGANANANNNAAPGAQAAPPAANAPAAAPGFAPFAGFWNPANQAQLPAQAANLQATQQIQLQMWAQQLATANNLNLHPPPPNAQQLNHWGAPLFNAGGPPAAPAVPQMPAPAVPPAAAAAVAPAAASGGGSHASPPAWLGPHREGSWPWLLDKISPGVTLANTHGGTDSPATVITAASKIELLAFKSCGYARLQVRGLDQSAIEPPAPLARSAWFAKREGATQAGMMARSDGLVGEVVQFMARGEQEALRNGWECVVGTGCWEEMEREAPTFDGCLEGGTGRFSGRVEKRDVEGVEEY